MIKHLGVVSKGFRGCSMQVTPAVFEQMKDLAYEYDSSTYPSVLNFFLWSYLYLRTFNSRNIPRWRYFSSGFQPKQPFLMQSGPGASLVNVPTTVVPYLQLPFYATFHLLYPKLFDATYRIVFKHRKHFVYQGHVLDFVDPETDEIPTALTIYPLFKVPLSERLQKYREIIETIINQYEPITLLQMSKTIIVEL